MDKTKQFLEKHQLSSSGIDAHRLVDLFLADMDAGLIGHKSSLLMIPTYIEADSKIKVHEPVIAIDAGGTNFRTAKMFFDEEMNLVTEHLKTNRMPAVDQELSKEDFFKVMAGYIEEYKEEADKIGFCFSYAVEIFPNRDGKLLGWSKEIKAPSVIGEMIGSSMLEAMGTPDKELVLLNDTVATLLAGKAATAGKDYDTYIGYILGTGTNACYIESNRNITKTDGLDLERNQIINIESGNFDKSPRTDIDLLFDSQTKNPGHYTFEKMIAGGYLGGLCTTALKMAAGEGVFSKEAEEPVSRFTEFSTEEVNKFASGVVEKTSALEKAFISESDRRAAIEIIDAIIERAAKLVALNLAAVILKTGKGKSGGRPVLMTIEGTTFYKLKNFRTLFEDFLKEYLSGENERFYEIVEVENSSLVGAAIAGIVN